MAGHTPPKRLQNYYQITGFISSGTYGRVYRAKGIKGNEGRTFAIKKFKPDKEGEPTYTGISQSATREMALCAELSHTNVIQHVETYLQDKTIYMVFGYAEHDLLQIVHHHSQLAQPRKPVPGATVRSILYQLLKGCDYLHKSWVMHRDLKPANIMVTSAGQVMIGDLGLARVFREPLVPLYTGDKVVVTIWYRAPELILGGRHYTPAVDLWAVGCIFAELVSLRPIFKGEEAKMDSKKNVPFQKSQMQKIVEVLGFPGEGQWPLLKSYPEHKELGTLYGAARPPRPMGLRTWWANQMKINNYPGNDSPGDQGLSLLEQLLDYNPETRLTAEQALKHKFFDVMRDGEGPGARDCFEGCSIEYPKRKISQEEYSQSLPGTKRSGLPDDSLRPPSKRLRDGF
ncbi:hypothetical protein FH972_023326 [Carpinus fangiana]|uniref:Cyclin-dependent kinase 8 n=1 Tax=Carpinus fangiana TaxID=176857 RepID=A0A5N6KV53_9ROSI|nr:hypothetical protein FH972_023326 [Carpinus fangiana]